MARIGQRDAREVRERFGPWFKSALSRTNKTIYQVRRALDDEIETRRLKAIAAGDAAVTPATACKLADAIGVSAGEALWHSYPATAIAVIDKAWACGGALDPSRRWYPGDDLDEWASDVVREPHGLGAAALYCCFFEAEPEPSAPLPVQEKLIAALWRALVVKNGDFTEYAIRGGKINEPRLRVAATILGDLSIDFRLRRAATIPLVRAAARSRAAGVFDDALTGWSE